MLVPEIKKLGHPEIDEEYEVDTPKEYDKDALFPETVIHHLVKSKYVWNFSLIYREKNFDTIKWKTSFAFRLMDDSGKNTEILMEKALFIGARAGIFFISIDDDINDNFNKLADMMDVFIEKTQGEAPFLVYGLIENKQKIAELKTNKELLNNLAEVKKWVSQHRGEFRLENLKEIKMNLSYLIKDYTHFILSKLKSKTNYPNLKLEEVHYIDYEDLSALKDIEATLAEQTKAGETIDNVLAELFFKYLKMPEFQEEIVEHPAEPKPSKVKLILEEIRKGIRRQCPKCSNNDRNKIREIVDKEKIIMKNPNIYGFKYICGTCGYEWRTQNGMVENKN